MLFLIRLLNFVHNSLDEVLNFQHYRGLSEIQLSYMTFTIWNMKVIHNYDNIVNEHY